MLNPVPSIEQNPDREEIEQVRSLLFGEIQRDNEKRFAALEAQLRELHLTMERRIAALTAENAASHADFVASLGNAVAELGHRIASLAGGAARDAPRHD